MDVNTEYPSGGPVTGGRQGWRARLLGVFNLNDPRWGRGGDEPPRAEGDPKPGEQDDGRPRGQRPQGPNQGPPDLDELWRDFNRKLGGLLGGKGGATAAAPAGRLASIRARSRRVLAPA